MRNPRRAVRIGRSDGALSGRPSSTFTPGIRPDKRSPKTRDPSVRKSITPSQYERRQNKDGYIRVRCIGCNGGYVQNNAPVPTECRACEHTGFVYVPKVWGKS